MSDSEHLLHRLRKLQITIGLALIDNPTVFLRHHEISRRDNLHCRVLTVQHVVGNIHKVDLPTPNIHRSARGTLCRAEYSTVWLLQDTANPGQPRTDFILRDLLVCPNRKLHRYMSGSNNGTS